MGKGYPLIKKVIWRYVRVFVSAFTVQLGFNFTEFDIARSVLIASVAALSTSFIFTEAHSFLGFCFYS